MAILVSTQYRENYGAHDWDGQGECPQYWKSKGGRDILIYGAEESASDVDVALVVGALRSKIEHNTYYSTEEIIGWELVHDNYVVDNDDKDYWDLGPTTYMDNPLP